MTAVWIVAAALALLVLHEAVQSVRFLYALAQLEASKRVWATADGFVLWPESLSLLLVDRHLTVADWSAAARRFRAP